MDEEGGSGRIVPYRRRRDGEMPHYEFLCKECKKSFSLVMTLTEYEKGHFTCPKCKSRKVEQKLSAFSAVTSKKS